MQLLFEHTVAAPREEVFRFHEDPAHLAVLLAGWSTFHLCAHDGAIRPGCVTRARERVLGIPFDMSFEHDLYEPPERFGEHQVRGPFRTFAHVHEFAPLPQGTRVIDRLELALGTRLGGELALRAIVVPRLRRFFACRHLNLDRIFGAARATGDALAARRLGRAR